ncbi:MAG: AAA family ATPase [Gammaproteobacteria bacterium]|nr:AAA family ATPase [Gammaproteobacteria bacterium]
MSATIEWLDGADLLTEQPQPIDWLVEGILPSGTVGDVFSPPGTGKTSLLTSLILTVAAGKRTWFGRACAAGPVMILGGEKSSRAVWVRDLHRATGGERFEVERGRIAIAPSTMGPLFQWHPRRHIWEPGSGYEATLTMAAALRPVLTCIDTLGRAAWGQDPISIPQQQALAQALEHLGRQIDGTLLTVSHTSQASGREDVQRRLDYTARAGSNGIPGHFRWLMGITKLDGREAAKLLHMDDDDERTIGELEKRNILAAAVSKPSEMAQPSPDWNRYSPSIFELLIDGSIVKLEPQERRALPSQVVVLSDTKKAAKATDGFQKIDDDEDLSWLK